MIINLPAMVRAHRKNTGRRDLRVRKAPGPKASHQAELFYKTELLRLVRAMVDAKNRLLIPTLRRTREQYETRKSKDTALDAAFTQEIQNSLDEMAKSFGGLDRVAQRLADLAVNRIADSSSEAFKASVQRAVGIDISPIISSGGVGDAVELAVKNNVALIKSIPNQYFDRIENAVWQNTGQGNRFEDLAETLKKIDDVTDSRAKLIARDQTGKINSAITQARSKSVGLNKYTWRTSNDERVRDSHAEKEGQVFSFDDPPSDTGNPGDDVSCRCTAEPYFDLEEEEASVGISPDDDAEAGS
ncbi:MAG: hypothetical protein E6R08_06370 [Nevskiaceae bacterium]|nr:MAG: hypothetical protein E6R08_06370 [Nevskiaceae bacterium]